MSSWNRRPNVVIPMAGEGKRFAEAGYDRIKPLIEINGLPMIAHVVDGITLDADYTFIVQKKHREQYDLDDTLRGIIPDCTIIDTGGGVLEGAVMTLLCAEEIINNDRPLVVVNSDNVIHFDWEDEIEYIIDEPVLWGLIGVFNPPGDRWSFVERDSLGLVTRVAEKERISDTATAGVYMWTRGDRFVESAREMIAANDRVNGEFYLAPTYNYLIRKGGIFDVFPVDMIDLGTPEALEQNRSRL